MHAHHHGTVLVGSSVHIPDTDEWREGAGCLTPSLRVPCSCACMSSPHHHAHSFASLCIHTEHWWRESGGIDIKGCMLSEFANMVAAVHVTQTDYKDAVSIAGWKNTKRAQPATRHMRSTYMRGSVVISRP